MPEKVNIVARKSDKAAVVISLRKDNGTENYQVVVDIKIGRGLIFEQGFVVTPHVEQLTCNFDLCAGDAIAVDDFVEVLQDVIGRNVSDMRGNGIGFGVVFESKDPKQ